MASACLQRSPAALPLLYSPSPTSTTPSPPLDQGLNPAPSAPWPAAANRERRQGQCVSFPLCQLGFQFNNRNNYLDKAESLVKWSQRNCPQAWQTGTTYDAVRLQGGSWLFQWANHCIITDRQQIKQWSLEAELIFSGCGLELRLM